MPKISIENINYIVTGSKEKIINFDLSSDLSGYIRNVSFFTETDTVGQEYIYPDGRYHIGVAKNNGISAVNTNVNSHGFAFIGSQGKTAFALFDVKDVAMRSKVSQRLENKNMEAYSTSDFTNAYLPHLKKNPIGFSQLENFSYGMTDSIVVAPVIKMTSMSESLIASKTEEFENGKPYSVKPIWSSYLNPYDKWDSQPYDPGILPNLLPIYTYTPLDNLSTVVYGMLSTEKISEDELKTKVSETISSYDAFRAFITDNGKEESMISVLFKPVYNFQNIDHNYVLEIPVDVPQIKDNDYDNGTVYADMIMGKNVYNDIYDMDISSLGNFSRIREYTGIHQTGGRLFTNYFDDVIASNGLNHNFNRTYQDETENIDLNPSVHPRNQTRDYMKVECIDAINRFVSLTNHKANLFTTKVYGLNDVLSSNEMLVSDSIVANNIRTNIENSIRRIVTNFVPAHTQFFGAIFEDKKFSRAQNSTETC